MKSQCFLHLQNHSVFSTLCRISTTNVRPLCITTVTPRKSVKIKKADDALKFKQGWLASLTPPPPSNPISSQNPFPCSESDHIRHGRKWVLGVDPDTNGALAILQFDDGAVSSAQVFDSPHLKVMIGERVRKRLDANSIVQLIRSLDAPLGTIAHIEQSNPFPKDGKQGWWSGGFGYGLWIGVLVSSGFSVVPVPSMSWKKEFELAGGSSTKDDSRRIASELFPSLSTSLKRKKDHGRAEALLIASYGKGLKPRSDT